MSRFIKTRIRPCWSSVIAQITSELRLVLGKTHYCIWISADGSADGHKFCNVEAAFAQLEFRYERLTLPDPLS